MSTHYCVDYVVKKGFIPGSITRIKMVNFLTFDDCDVYPGPHLNIVVGPNGTGKSSLTHAVCLACCGTTSDIARSNELKSFIKTGKEGQEAYVEIDVLDYDDSLLTVRRTLSSTSNKSAWMINSKTATQKAVKEHMNRLSIDVDNLCTFMPQDRVGEFTRFKPEELLHNTLKSISARIGEKSLYEEQTELADQESVKEDLNRSKRAKESAKAALEAQVAAMSSEIERLDRRAEAISHLKLCKLKLLKVEGDALREKETELGRLMEEKNQALLAEKEKIGPLEAKERALRAKQAKRDKAKELAQTRNTTLLTSLTRKVDNLDNLKIEVENASRAIAGAAEEHHNKQQKLEIERANLNQLEVDLNVSQQKIPEITAKLEEASRRLSKVTIEIRSVRDSMDENRVAVNELNGAITSLRRTANDLQDPRQIFKQKLRQMADSNPGQQKSYLDTIEAMNILERSEQDWRASGKLRGEVTGPIAMHLCVAEPAIAVIVNTSTKLSKLLSFAVTCREDFNTLKSAFKDMFVDITIMNQAVDIPRPFPPQLLGEIGLVQLIDEVSCSPVIRSFLANETGLGTHLLGKATNAADLAGKLSSENLGSRLMEHSRGFTATILEPMTAAQSRGNTARKMVQHSGFRSRYMRPTDPPVLKSNNVDISKGPGCIKSSTGGTEEVQERRTSLEAQIADKTRVLQEIENVQRGLSTKLQQLMSESDVINTSKRTLAVAKKAPDIIKGKRDTSRSKISDLEKQLHSGIEAESKILKSTLKKAMDLLLKGMDEAVKAGEEFRVHRVSYEILKSVHDDIQEELSNTSLKLRDARAGIASFARAVKDATEQQQQAVKDRNEKEVELREIIDDMGGEEVFINEVYPKVIEHCPEGTVDEINARIGRLQALINQSIDNPDLRNRHAVSSAELARLTVEVEAAQDAENNVQGHFDARKEIWLKAVQTIQEKISRLFKQYMEELNFAGQVELVKEGTIMDYKMQIQVSFRENSLISNLDASKHSGGERAVSTVMYLMALQELTSAPFRVVDEINQGMDMRNERLVFERICKSCCGVPPGDDAVPASGPAADDSNSTAISTAMMRPQYFLVTPKLLPGLRAMDNNMVSVLFIWSGPGVINKWQLPEVIDALISPQEQEKLQRTPAAAKRSHEDRSGRGRAAAAAKGSDFTLDCGNEKDNSEDDDEDDHGSAKRVAIAVGGNKRSLGKAEAVVGGEEKKARRTHRK